MSRPTRSRRAIPWRTRMAPAEPETIRSVSPAFCHRAPLVWDWRERPSEPAQVVLRFRDNVCTLAFIFLLPEKPDEISGHLPQQSSFPATDRSISGCYLRAAVWSTQLLLAGSLGASWL